MLCICIGVSGISNSGLCKSWQKILKIAVQKIQIAEAGICFTITPPTGIVLN